MCYSVCVAIALTKEREHDLIIVFYTFVFTTCADTCTTPGSILRFVALMGDINEAIHFMEKKALLSSTTGL